MKNTKDSVKKIETGDPTFEKFIVSTKDEQNNSSEIESFVFYLDEKKNPIAKDKATKFSLIEKYPDGNTKFTYGYCNTK